MFTPFGANFFVTGNLNQPAAGGDHSNINSGPVSGSLEISTDLAAQVKGTRERWKMCLQCALPAIVLHLLWGFYPSSLPFLASSSSSLLSNPREVVAGGISTAEARSILLWEYKLSTAKFWSFTVAAEPCGEWTIFVLDVVLIIAQYVLMTLLVIASGSPGDGSVVPVLPRPPRSMHLLFAGGSAGAGLKRPQSPCVVGEGGNAREVQEAADLCAA